MLKKLKIESYRSIKNIFVNLDKINIITGPNGCGKSNLYKSVFLIASAASGNLAQTIVQEGGMASTLWAGKRMLKKAVRLNIEITLEDFVYGLSLGLPKSTNSAFILDPVVKKEYIQYKVNGRNAKIMERGNDNVFIRNQDGKMIQYFGNLISSESILSQITDPKNYPLLSYFSENIKKWRFYHHLRTDAQSPIRFPQFGHYSPLLNHDGANLAATLQTLFEMGQESIIHQFFVLVFPKNQLIITHNEGLFGLEMQVAGLNRRLNARELSDGTLRYICLLALLTNPKPPELIAINEPEMSLNQDLLFPLAELIIYAAQRTQLWITTHSRILADYIENQSGIKTILLGQKNGETQLANFI